MDVEPAPSAAQCEQEHEAAAAAEVFLDDRILQEVVMVLVVAMEVDAAAAARLEHEVAMEHDVAAGNMF
jgi:hypothetical protein